MVQTSHNSAQQHTIQASLSVVIPAAGIGSRMASTTAKQYLRINKKTILEHTVELFLAHELIDTVVVALHANDSVFDSLDIAKHEKIQTIVGGAERVDSVLAGLQLLQKQDKSKNASANGTLHYVLVHDAARPCLMPDTLDKLINTCITAHANDQADGAILATPVIDTVKQTTVTTESLEANIDNNRCTHTVIEQSIDRNNLWLAQTPQMFAVNELCNAIEANVRYKHLITDEASAMEMSNKKVIIVESPASNLKITRPQDIALAEFYLNKNRK